MLGYLSVDIVAHSFFCSLLEIDNILAYFSAKKRLLFIDPDITMQLNKYKTEYFKFKLSFSYEFIISTVNHLSYECRFRFNSTKCTKGMAYLCYVVIS